jgi:hypothetical protein
MSIKKPFSKKKIRTSLLSNDDNVESTSKATGFVQYQDDQQTPIHHATSLSFVSVNCDAGVG